MNKPLIVAELSANVAACGKVDVAIEMVKAAAAAGADAVKLQTWLEPMVIDSDVRMTSGPWAGVTLATLYEQAKCPIEWHQPLFDGAREAGIFAFSTPFDRPSVNLLEMLECPMYKVASFELTDIRLLRWIARTGKPIILSTGMAYKHEVALAVKEIDLYSPLGQHHDVTILRCVSAYPADPQEAHLASMKHYQSIRENIRVGFSDHTMTDGAACVAAAMGATLIEKHFTLDRSLGGPDAGFSLEPDEFARMVKNVRAAAVATGAVVYGPSKGEMIGLRRGAYWARDLPSGHVVTADDIISARPETITSIFDSLTYWVGRELEEPVAERSPASLPSALIPKHKGGV